MNPAPCEVAIVGTPDRASAAGPCSQIRPMITPLRKVLSDLFPDARRVSSTPSTASSNTDVQAGATCDSPGDTLCKLGSVKAMPDTDGQKLVSTKGWTLEHLLEMGMKPVERVSALQGASEIQKAIRRYEDDGIPIIIEDWHKTAQWPKDDLFTVKWLLENGEQKIMARNGITRKDEEMLLSSFIELSQKASHFASEEESARYYGKDAVCPKPWKDWLLKGALPEELLPGGPDDVLEFLDDNERVETLMCYLGIGDTYTAAHKDLCASSGHNLMCYTEDGGSSFWFMTGSSDIPRVTTWFQKLKYELDHETYVVSPEQFAKAPFPVFVAEQKLGDLVLVPKRSCHQVINNRGLTVKMSWSRMTVDGLVTAFHHELPVYRRVCRQETYRVKLLSYRALLKYSNDLQQANQDNARKSLSPLTPLSGSFSRSPSPKPTLDTKIHTICGRLAKLLKLFDKIIVEEYNGDADCELRIASSSAAISQGSNSDSPPSSQASTSHDVTYQADVCGGLTCDFCGADIFQSFFECRKCVSTKRNSNEGMGWSKAAPVLAPTSEMDYVIICPCCYVEGRSCLCQVMTPVQSIATERLIEARNRAADLLNQEMLITQNSTQFVPLSHQTLSTIEHPQIFASACKLLDSRSSKYNISHSERTCSRSGGHSHTLPSIQVLPCKRCHYSSCFWHILAMGFHASEVIMHQAKDKTHGVWHENHKDRRITYISLEKEAKNAEKVGSATDMRISLVLYALKFYACFPINQKSVLKGWYDLYKLVSSDEEPSNSVDAKASKDSDDMPLTDLSTPAHSPFPTEAIDDRSSVLSRSSSGSRATSTGRQGGAFVEVPKLTSTKRKRYRPMEAEGSGRAAIARMAANKKPKPFEEVFNGLYGHQATQLVTEEASASTSKRNKRVTMNVPVEKYARKRQASLETLTLSDVSEDTRRMANRDSDPDYIESERMTYSPPLRGPSKRKSTFRPSNLPKGGRERRKRVSTRINSPELDEEEEAEGHRRSGQKQIEMLAPPKASKRPRIESPKSTLLKFTKRKLDAATVTSTERTAEVSTHSPRLNAYPQSTHPDAHHSSTTKGKAQIVALEKKFEELDARQTRLEMEYRNRIHKLEDTCQRLSLMVQEKDTQLGWVTGELYRLGAVVAQQGETYGEILPGRALLENHVGSVVLQTNGAGHAFHAEQFRSQLGDVGRAKDDLLRQPTAMDRYRQNDFDHAYARQYLPSQSDPPFASDSRLPAPPPQARSPASALPDSIQEKESPRNAKVSRWDVRPDTIARDANSSLLPSSSWYPSSQPQSQPHSLETSTSHQGDPSSPTPTARKAVRPIQTAPAPSRAPARRLSMGARRSIIVPDSDKNSESSRSQ